jgi:pimeloyl-ACP methyl ester carboxylesterase
LNWYRNIDRNWELLAPWAADALVTVPALYVAGDRALVVRFDGMDQRIPNSKFVPKLQRTIMLPGCGYWTQQERAREVNAAMLEFLKGL